MSLETDRVRQSDRLLQEQSEANEHLLMASLRAQEDADAFREEAVIAEERAARLKEREAELLATAEFRERMIGMLGHDLRSPLNAIVMGAGLMLGHGELSESDARIASRIVSSSQRMERMISQMLEFTRARLGGGFHLELAPADLGALCGDVADELRLASSVEVVQTVEGDVTGVWDVDRLAEVISNIAGNATTHATPGTPVTIRVVAVGDDVVMEIENQGREIPPQLVREIFLPFRRGEGASANRAGHLGLGLYIAHEVVRSHGGTLAVRSAEGRTTFTASLPRVPPRG